MRLEAVFSDGTRDSKLADLAQPAALDQLLPGVGAWEVEIGFGKGRYLLQRALERPERRFFGVEVVSRYYRLLRDRARRRGVSNLLLARGEALYLLSAVVPAAFASKLHVYFPDPWPKSKHHKRRLFDPETVDLVLGVLGAGGELFFATDFLEYGQRVREILESYPGLDVEPRDRPWPDGARTNYEAKYVAEGRPILRLHGRLAEVRSRSQLAGRAQLHPEGRRGILAATAVRSDD